MTAPTTIGFEGDTKDSAIGSGINISKSGFDNYWLCPTLCGNPPPPPAAQLTSPGTNWTYYDGHSLW